MAQHEDRSDRIEVRLPMTDFVRQVASDAAKEAAREVLDQYRQNCPTLPKLMELQRSVSDIRNNRRDLIQKTWEITKIVVAAIFGWYLANYPFIKEIKK